MSDFKTYPDVSDFNWPNEGSAVIFDFEFTSWPGSLARNWIEDWEHREIIQIGAVRAYFFENEIKKKESFEVFIKPKINPILSDHIQKLTGISNDLINEKGKSFECAMAEFYAFVGKDETLFCNGLDGEILRENYSLYGLMYPLKKDRIINLRPKTSEMLNINPDKLISSQFPVIVGGSLLDKQHDAVYDAESIIYGLNILRNSGRI